MCHPERSRHGGGGGGGKLPRTLYALFVPLGIARYPSFSVLCVTKNMSHARTAPRSAFALLIDHAPRALWDHLRAIATSRMLIEFTHETLLLHCTWYICIYGVFAVFPPAECPPAPGAANTHTQTHTDGSARCI